MTKILILQFRYTKNKRPQNQNGSATS